MRKSIFRSTIFSTMLLAAFSMPVEAQGENPQGNIDPQERRELRKGRREIRADTKEIRGDRREIRNDRRDLKADVRDYRRDRRDGASQAELRADRQEIREITVNYAVTDASFVRTAAIGARMFAITGVTAAAPEEIRGSNRSLPNGGEHRRACSPSSFLSGNAQVTR